MNEIINYVMNTPGNTNPNVLKGLLNKVGGGSGGAVPQPSDANPAPVGETANPGVSDDYARADHVHAPGLQFTPLVLTMVPTNPSNPFQGGTYTGATPEEVVAARRSGRAIRASLGGRAFDVTGESESALIGQFLYQIASTIFFVQVTISKVDTVYAAHGFTGLQVPD